MSIINEIERLNNLKEKNAISEDEFLMLKKELLENNKIEDKKCIRKELSDEKLWCSFIHLSQLCGFIFPLLGSVIPIVLWQLKKDKSELIFKFFSISSIIDFCLIQSNIRVWASLPPPRKKH